MTWLTNEISYLDHQLDIQINSDDKGFGGIKKALRLEICTAMIKVKFVLGFFLLLLFYLFIY